MNAIVRMTGPHPSRIRHAARLRPVWHVSIVDTENTPQGTLYRVLSYQRAVTLSCNMARDRKLYLHVDALASIG